VLCCAVCCAQGNAIGSGKRLTSTVNSCGICGGELKDNSHLGQEVRQHMRPACLFCMCDPLHGFCMFSMCDPFQAPRDCGMHLSVPLASPLHTHTHTQTTTPSHSPPLPPSLALTYSLLLSLCGSWRASTASLCWYAQCVNLSLPLPPCLVPPLHSVCCRAGAPAGVQTPLPCLMAHLWPPVPCTGPHPPQNPTVCC
jgi:hypothetical protein